ncbi:hypothetical protein [Micromonospora sp. NPDC005299]|uniref:hypothetical protein n=1 Tax=Micromonospora sp. NPDC005299 TaxID=3364231 RepID=UPI0036B7A324
MRQALISACGAMLAATLAVSACSASKPKKVELAPANNKAVGEKITVTGNVPVNLKVQTDEKVGAKFQAVIPMGPAVHLEPVTDLPEAATITFPLANALAPGTTPLVATADTDKGPWQLVKAALSADRRSVIVQEKHLAKWWQILMPDVPAMQDLFVKELNAAMQGDMLTDAPQPKCQNEDQAKANLDVNVITKDSLSWCLGMEKGKRVLKAANRTKFPLRIMVTLSSGNGQTGKVLGPINIKPTPFTALNDRAAGLMLLTPFQEVAYPIDVKPDDRVSLSTEFEKAGYSLGILQTTVIALLNIEADFGTRGSKIGKVKTESFTDAAKIIDGLMKNDTCAYAVMQPAYSTDVRQIDFTRIVRECFTGQLAAKAFGWQSSLVLPIMTEQAAQGYYTEEFHALGDKVNGQVHSRALLFGGNGQRPRLNPDTLVGRWTYDCSDNNYHIVAVITPDHKVEWTLNNGEKAATLRFINEGSNLAAVVESTFYQGQEIFRYSTAEEVDWMRPLATYGVHMDDEGRLEFSGTSSLDTLYKEGDIQTQC